MAWIESHQGLARHPKTKRLTRLLNISVPAVIGHLHLLWWWAMDFAQDGDLSKFDAYDICDACDWSGDGQVFIDALHEVGFIDLTDEGTYIIHDWYDYAGRLIEKRASDAERKRNSRRKNEKSIDDPEDVQETSNGHPRDGARNLTVPNHTLPKPTKPKVIKNHYAEFVLLTDEEYQKLIEEYGEENTKTAIRILDDYKGAKGTKYKSDYRAMRNWVFYRVEEERNKVRQFVPRQPTRGTSNKPQIAIAGNKPTTPLTEEEMDAIIQIGKQWEAK